MARPLFDILHSHFARLDEICPVVPGAIVSKPLLNEPSIRQVVFAMDSGQELNEHRAPFVAVVQMIDGEVDFTVEGQTHTLAAGAWLSMPADAPHSLVANKPSRFTLTLVKTSSNGNAS